MIDRAGANRRAFNAGRRQILRAGIVMPALSAALTSMPTPAAAADIPDIIAAAKPSVVAVGVLAPTQNPRFRFLGTGFAVGDGKRVVTAAHAVPALDPTRYESMAIAIPGTDGPRIVRASVKATDRMSDLALLEFEEGGLPVMQIADPGEAREGLEILLLGFPLGNTLGLFVSAHRGMIASVAPMAIPAASSTGLNERSVRALRGTQIELLQLDLTALPGNSGGPVIDARTGRVLGILSFSAIRAQQQALSSGVAFAIPASAARPLIDAR